MTPKTVLTTAALAVLALSGVVGAQPMPAPKIEVIGAPAEPDAIPLYGAETPGSASSEDWNLNFGNIGVRNVTRPTLTPVFPAKGKANGAAVIVAPGGAFMALAIDHEGWKVAHALADRGITAFVLKYRLIATPKDNLESLHFMGAHMMKEVGHPMDGELLRASKAPDDARAAIAMVRANAHKWRIDGARVGIIGFSAGAMTARRVAIDGEAATRPAFVGYIYGPQDPETVPADAPPMFDAIALDDSLFPNKGFAIAQSWMAAKRPVEVHGYQKGEHGFGLGRKGQTNTMMIDQFVAWLSMQGLLTAKAAK